MARKFDDFIEAYLRYADDGFCPPQFSLWSCLSIVAAALERRVFLPWNDTFAYYPNIYVLLVSMPGDGKSVALNKAVELLQDANRKTSTLNIMPNQVTEAKFIELMGNGRSFTEHRGGKEIIHRQNAGYYWASEASNSLKNVFGDFIACLTDYYDCPATWERATKKDGKPIRLTNVCMNLLAGSTFDYLGKLVSDENIMGGFASRLIYVVSKNKHVNAQQFQLGGFDAVAEAERRHYREALIEDLACIARMIGPMSAEPAFGRAWEAWYPVYEAKRRNLDSEKAQSILARTNTNVLKVAMLMSASESDDRILKLRHWERAMELVQKLQGDAPGVFRQARAQSSQKSPGNLASIILHAIETGGANLSFEELKGRIVARGHQMRNIDETISALVACGALSRDGSGKPKILGDPNNYL